MFVASAGWLLRGWVLDSSRRVWAGSGGFGTDWGRIRPVSVPRPADNAEMHDPTTDAPQPRNPLHGITLEAIVRALEEHYGWDDLGRRIPIRCFVQDPSVASSLKFLRKTPWAREKVESLYLFMLREQRRAMR